MFDLSGWGEPPEDWEPIPDEVFAEIGPPPQVDDGLAPLFDGPDALVELAESLPVSANTLVLVSAVPVEQLTAAGRAKALALLTAVQSHAAGCAAEVTAALAGPTPSTARERADDFAAHEVAVATRTSVYGADRQVAFARHLAERLAATRVALVAGRISEAQARLLSERTAGLDDEVAGEVEAAMLRFSHRQSLANFRRALNGWIARKDPDWTAKANRARQEVQVSHTALGDGTGELCVRGPLEVTTQISMALSAYAAQTRDELGGTADARKLAGLRDMIERYLASDTAPRRHGRLPTVDVTIDLPTLLGLQQGVAQLPGVGPLPPSAAAWLLADGAPLRRLVTDPVGGRCLDYGMTSYTVPPELAEHLVKTHVNAAAPHSTVPAAGADMEHNQPHTTGGTTDARNLTPVCRRWHRAKTHGGWTYTKNPDTDTVTWRSPNGLTCQIDPYDYRAGP